MRKALTYLLLVLAGWVYLELQTQGTRGAFGGRLAWAFEPLESVREEPGPPPARITDQVRDHLNGVMAQYERDRERQARPLP